MSILSEQLHYTLDAFSDEKLGNYYKGKVRDNFHHKDEIIHMI